MKHHIENEILIGMDNGDVENNGGGEQVLETDNVRISQRTWSETNVLAWASCKMAANCKRYYGGRAHTLR